MARITLEDAARAHTTPVSAPAQPGRKISLAAAEKAAPQSAGSLFTRGLVDFIHDVGALGGLLYDWTLAPANVPDPDVARAVGADPNDPEVAARGSSAFEGVNQSRARTHTLMESADFYRGEPVGPRERAIHAIGRGGPLAAVGAAGAGPVAGAAVLAGAAGGPFVGEYTQEALTPEGEDPGLGAVLGGTGAEILATLPLAMIGNPGAMSSLVDNPGRVVSTLQKMRAEKLAASAPPEARRVLDELNRGTRRLWDTMNRGSREIVGEAPTFDLVDMYDISAYYKGKFPIDPDGQIDYAAVAADLLERDLARNPEIPLRPTQILEPEGASSDTLRRLEEGLVRLSPDGDNWSNVVAGQSRNAERAMRQQFVSQLRSGTAAGYVEGATRTVERAAASARQAWDAVDWEGMPRVRLKYLQDSANNVLRNSAYQEELVPQIVKRVAKGGKSMDHIDMQSVQNIRSRLIAVIQEGRDGGQAAITAQKAREMLQELDGVVDGMFTVGADGRNAFGQFIAEDGRDKLVGWQRARKAWRDYKALEDPDKLTGGDFTRALQSKNPDISVGRTAVSSRADAERAIALATDQETRVALERSVQEFLLGKPRPVTGRSVTGFSHSPTQVMDRLNSNREGVDLILGEAYTADLERLMQAWSGSKVGRVGSVAMETTTNTSGQASMGAFRKAMSILRRPPTDPVSATKTMAELLFDSLPDNAAALTLMQTIQLDRGLMANMLRLPTEVDPTVFSLQMQRAMQVARHQARTPETLIRAAEDVNIILRDEQQPSPWRR